MIHCTPQDHTYHSSTDRSIADNIITQNKRLVIFANQAEALHKCNLKKIDNIIRLTGLDRGKFYYLTAAVNTKNIFDFIKDELEIDHINLLESDQFISVVNKLNDIDYKIGIKPKLFNCLNKNQRSHRCLIVAEIIKNNLLDKSYTSLYGFSDQNSWSPLELVDSAQVFDKQLADVLKNNLNLFPLHVNSAASKNPIRIEDQDRFLYSDSYFTLVTETIFFNNYLDPMVDTMIPSTFPTEKIYKPIAAKHPFIVLSTPNFLQHMRKLGFRTFHPFINEDYDLEIDDMKRFRLVVNEMLRLCNFTNEEWLLWQENIKDIVEYNYEFYNNNTKLSSFDISNLIKILEEK